MVELQDQLGIKQGDTTTIRDITAPTAGDDYISSYYNILAAIETNTVHFADTQDQLPQPGDGTKYSDGLVGVAQTEAEDSEQLSLHYYDFDENEWVDTFNTSIIKHIQNKIGDVDQIPGFSRDFNGDPTDNGDLVIAADYRASEPAGYFHGNIDTDYSDTNNAVHDNKPFRPGDKRQYAYARNGSSGYLRGALRAAPVSYRQWMNRYWNEFSGIDTVYPDGWAHETILTKEEISEEFTLTVEYLEDGSAFEFYKDGTKVATWSGLERDGELYFTSLDASYIYQSNGGFQITDIGYDIDKPWVDLSTHVENLHAADDALQTEVIENSADIGPVEEISGTRILNPNDAHLNVDEPNPRFNNDDLVIADRKYQIVNKSRKFRAPAGYAHANAYVHDNKPFSPGDKRQYAYNQMSSPTDLYGTLRDGPQTSPNEDTIYERQDGEEYVTEYWALSGSIVDNRISAVTGIEFITELPDSESPSDAPWDPIPSDDEGIRVDFTLTVEYLEDGSAFEFYKDGTKVATWSGLESYGDLYFSSCEEGGFSNAEDHSLRITAIGSNVDKAGSNLSTHVKNLYDSVGDLGTKADLQTQINELQAELTDLKTQLNEKS